MVNEARFQYAYISYELGPWNTPPPKNPTDFLDPTYAKNITVGYSFPSLNYGHKYAADGVESRWQLNDSLSIQKGAHSIKLGFDVSYVPYTDAVATTLNGSYSFGVDMPFDNTPATINKLCATLTVTCPSAFTQNAVPLLYYLPSTQQAYFIQDSWKAKPNLTISSGLRYDLQRGSAFLNTYTPIVNPPAFPAIPYQGNPHDRGDWNNFGPRVGVSWDPFKKGRDVFRGGYGIYYNFIQTELSEAEKLNFVACAITLTSTATNQVQYPNPYNGQTVTTFCAATKNTNVTILSPSSQQSVSASVFRWVQPPAWQGYIPIGRRSLHSRPARLQGLRSEPAGKLSDRHAGHQTKWQYGPDPTARLHRRQRVSGSLFQAHQATEPSLYVYRRLCTFIGV